VSLAAHLMSALEIRAAVVSGEASAREIVEATLERIEALNAKLGAFTDVTAKRALAKATAIDGRRARGETLGPLVGAPFAVKNLFDVAGLTTRAGSLINRDRAPASADATLAAGSRRPARFWSARSTWANTPTTSPARTRTRGPRATRMTPGA
jgi:Asp-tRNA(Asn)/Glu-tRNA(Gln) amidotransferase A subunit family amidase